MLFLALFVSLQFTRQNKVLYAINRQRQTATVESSKQ